MKHLPIICISLALVTSAAAGCASRPEASSQGGRSASQSAPQTLGARAGALQITERGARPSMKGPAENFTGAVTVEPLFAAAEHTRAAGASVTFEPGARSAWHSHPAGQTLIVTSGAGWVQAQGAEKQALKVGDVVWTPPGVKHWHGATANEAMTHIAIQEHVDGKVVDWLEKVSDEQYRN